MAFAGTTFVLFESGFGAADTAATAFTLLYYVPGLIAQAALQVTTRGLFPQDTKTPVKIGFYTVVLNFLLSLALQGAAWEPGFGLAYSLSPCST